MQWHELTGVKSNRIQGVDMENYPRNELCITAATSASRVHLQFMQHLPYAHLTLDKTLPKLSSQKEDVLILHSRKQPLQNNGSLNQQRTDTQLVQNHKLVSACACSLDFNLFSIKSGPNSTYICFNFFLFFLWT